MCVCVSVGAGCGEHRALQRFLLSSVQDAPSTEASAGQAHQAVDLPQVSYPVNFPLTSVENVEENCQFQVLTNEIFVCRYLNYWKSFSHTYPGNYYPINYYFWQRAVAVAGTFKASSVNLELFFSVKVVSGDSVSSHGPKKIKICPHKVWMLQMYHRKYEAATLVHSYIHIYG